MLAVILSSSDACTYIIPVYTHSLTDTHTQLTLPYTHHTHRILRSLPVMQCVCLLSLSQGVSTLILQLTLPQPPALCYTLAGLTHYTALVTLSLMVVYPVLKTLKVFKMIWYEKRWLIAPFAAVALSKCARAC